MLKKSDVPAPPPLKKETVNVPELGGEVLVQGTLLADKLVAAVGKPGFARVAIILACCVLVDGGEKDGKPVGMIPLYTADEWERWGNSNYIAAMNLWSKIDELSDFSGVVAEKKPRAQKSDSPVA